LTAVFHGLPQLPYSNLRIHFREGQRAPLVAPSACRTFATRRGLTPWNAPLAAATSSPEFRVSKGIGSGESCPDGATPPFGPSAVGGTLNSQAGSYASFYLHPTRGASEQALPAYSPTPAPRFSGEIACIYYCPDAAI